MKKYMLFSVIAALLFAGTAEAKQAAPKEKQRVVQSLMAQSAKKHKKKKKHHYAPPYVAPAAPAPPAPPAPLALGDSEAHNAALNAAYNVYLADGPATYYGVDGCSRQDTYNVVCSDYEGGYDGYGNYECDWNQYVTRSGYNGIALSYNNLYCFYY